MIRLERSVAVHSFDAEATVAIGRDRPELLAVARLAADLGRPLDGRDITRELLGGLPEQLGWRVIERSVALGLLERPEDRGAARLSAAGAAALAQSAVPVPPSETWRFSLIDDPLVDDPLVDVVRIETPSAKQERSALHAAKREQRARPGPGQPLPGAIGRAAGAGRVGSSVVTGVPFEVRSAAEHGLAGPRGSLRLLLEWDRDAGSATPSVTLRGELDAGPEDPQRPRQVDRALRDARALDGVSYEGLWMALIAASTGLGGPELGSWCERLHELVVPVAFDDRLENEARTSMRRDQRIPEVEPRGLGRFEPSTLRRIRLVPRTRDDAQQWAEWMQWDGVGDYCTPDRLEEISRDTAARFSSQLPFPAPELPGPEELLRRARQSFATDPRARYLLAPADLGLWRPR